MFGIRVAVAAAEVVRFMRMMDGKFGTKGTGGVSCRSNLVEGEIQRSMHVCTRRKSECYATIILHVLVCDTTLIL